MEINIELLAIAITITAIVSLLAGYLITNTMIRKSIENKCQHIVKEAQAEAEVLKKERMLLQQGTSSTC